MFTNSPVWDVLLGKKTSTQTALPFRLFRFSSRNPDYNYQNIFASVIMQRVCDPLSYYLTVIIMLTKFIFGVYFIQKKTTQH